MTPKDIELFALCVDAPLYAMELHRIQAKETSVN